MVCKEEGTEGCNVITAVEEQQKSRRRQQEDQEEAYDATFDFR